MAAETHEGVGEVGCVELQVEHAPGGGGEFLGLQGEEAQTGQVEEQVAGRVGAEHDLGEVADGQAAGAAEPGVLLRERQGGPGPGPGRSKPPGGGGCCGVLLWRIRSLV